VGSFERFLFRWRYRTIPLLRPRGIFDKRLPPVAARSYLFKAEKKVGKCDLSCPDVLRDKLLSDGRKVGLNVYFSCHILLVVYNC
jgi:hypothetical protein